MNLGDGMLVIGRCERMGLGSMTEDFCRAFHPEHLVVVDRGREQMFSPHDVARNVYRSSGEVPPIPTQVHTLVGFETFYNTTFLVRAIQREIKVVLFPMWEWTLDEHARSSQKLVVLSDTDAQYYEKYRDNVVPMRWPASPACHAERVLNWPPRTFVHIAGNASHNRDGTTQVLEAAKYLKGTDSKLIVYSAFRADQWEHDKTAPIEFCQAAKSRRELFDRADCLVQPRRLGGHSLPIDEAVGEGIPVVTLVGDDWNCRASFTVSAISQAPERFGRVWAPMHRTDAGELGSLLYRLARGELARPEPKSLPTWDDFKSEWSAKIV